MSESDNPENPPEVPTGRRRDYIASTNPGSRLPHMYVQVNSLSKVCNFVSLLMNLISVYIKTSNLPLQWVLFTSITDLPHSHRVFLP